VKGEAESKTVGRTLCGGEETGENAPDSWGACMEVSLSGFMEKGKPRPKVVVS